MFAAGETGLWNYVQHLESKLKQLVEQVETNHRHQTQLMERLGSQEQHIVALTDEVAALRQQLLAPGPQQEEAPTEPQ